MEKSFQSLKKAMSTPLVLTFPQFEKAFIIETGASSVANGLVLAQQKDG